MIFLPDPVPRRIATAIVLICLFFSGVAAIINQTVWQRALKVYLAGSEALSSMIVVLVFMLGLGLGSWLMGKRAGSVKNPVRLLGLVELALLGVNAVICLALSLDVAAGANALQQAAHAMGMPLRLLYVIVSTVVLLVPCFLMGITMPLASEGAQAQLEQKDSRFLTTLFFLNTLGAVGGGLASGFLLMPYYGQKASLLVAASLNGLAGIGLILLRLKSRAHEYETAPSAMPEQETVLSPLSAHPLGAGFALGFLALAYEMLLFRLAGVIFQPLPYTFAVTLVLYLLLWSVGLWMARYRTWNLSLVLLASAALTAFVPQWNSELHFRFSIIPGFNLMPELCQLLTLLPCTGFGIAFGRVLADNAQHWGKDVGRFYFMNTLGSALGILVATLVGFRFHPMFLGWGIAAGYLLLAFWARRSAGRSDVAPMKMPIKLAALVAGVVWVIYASQMVGVLNYMRQPDSAHKMYFSPEGVVEVTNRKAMYWEGLWHSDLSVDGDHRGTNNWLLAVVPYLCHSDASGALDALVVGLGTGITAETLARFPSVEKVDTYEINLSLKRLLADFPEGTLGVGHDPKVRIDWSDGRTGMAINATTYDIITQQPLYLKQAGSSILLSREYMKLVKSRLKPGGIFAVYCNSFGIEGQAAIVRRTAAEVFPYCKSFGKGYLVVVSNEPFEYNLEVLAARLAALPQDSVVANELKTYGVDKLAAYLDNPPLKWDDTAVIVTDDHPIVEYPDVAEKLYRRDAAAD